MESEYRNGTESNELRASRGSWLMADACGASMAGLLAFGVYVLTLSHGLYPDASAKLVVTTARLIPAQPADHPLWWLLTGWLARLPWGTLPFRLNLFSAVCGAASVALLGGLVEQWLWMVVRKYKRKTGLSGIYGQPGRRNKAFVQKIYTDDPRIEARIAAAIRLGAWAAALALAFSVPFWSAATRLHLQTYDMLLVLLAIRATLWDSQRPNRTRILLVAAICGWGFIESPLFIPLTPALFFLLLHNRLGWQISWHRHVALAFQGGLAGAGLGLLLLWRIQQLATSDSRALPRVLLSLLSSHWLAIRRFVPEVNWIWILALAFAPAVAVIVACRRALFRRNASLTAMCVVFVFTSSLCLANAPGSPWALLSPLDQLPVMAYLAIAVTVGFLVVFWRLTAVMPDSKERAPSPTATADATQARRHLPRSVNAGHPAANRPAAADADTSADDRTSSGSKGRATTRDRIAVASALYGLLLAVVVIAACLNHNRASGRNGAFADGMAGEILDRLGARDWVVSGESELDLHLLVLARERGRVLHLAPLSRYPGPFKRLIGRAITDDPALAIRQGDLLNALERGVPSFVQEWLAGDASVEERLLTVVVPEVWAAGGRRPVTDGFGFTGVREPEVLRDRDLLGTHRECWDRFARQLAPDRPLHGQAGRLRTRLRRLAGLTANNLGVLLEDLNRTGDAIEAYDAALRIEPDNLSARLNRMVAAHDHSQAASNAIVRWANKQRATGRMPTLLEVAQTHGDIRRPEVLARQGMAWARYGETGLARTQLARAMLLAPPEMAGTLYQQLGSVDWHRGDVAKAEEAYRQALQINSRDVKAMVGLAVAALDRGQWDDARFWLDRARQAQAPRAVLAAPTAVLLDATGQTDAAVIELQASTDSGHASMEEWALLADMLLKQGAIDEVERRVVPAMERMTGGGGHVLVQLVKARALCSRKPVNYEAARQALKRCLRLRPDMTAIWDDLLLLGMASDNMRALTEDIQVVLNAMPEHALGNRLLGTHLLEQDDLQRALAALQRSVNARPTVEALNNLAETLRRLKRLDEAERTVRAALSMNDRIYAVWDTLGGVLLDLGRLDEASEAVEKALALNESDPEVLMHLVRIRNKQGRLDEMREILARPALKGVPVRL